MLLAGVAHFRARFALYDLPERWVGVRQEHFSNFLHHAVLSADQSTNGLYATRCEVLTHPKLNRTFLVGDEHGRCGND